MPQVSRIRKRGKISVTVSVRIDWTPEPTNSRYRLLDETGAPILDEDGNYILDERAP